MLDRFKTWISDNVSYIAFLPIIFLLSLSVDKLIWLYFLLLVTFFFIWYRRGNLGYAVVFSFLYLPIWYLSFLLLPFREIIWSFIYVLSLLIFLEDKVFGIILIIEALILFPYLLLVNNILNFEFVIFLASLFGFLGVSFLFQSFLLGLLTSLFLFEVNILFLVFPYFSIFRFVVISIISLILLLVFQQKKAQKS